MQSTEQSDGDGVIRVSPGWTPPSESGQPSSPDAPRGALPARGRSPALAAILSFIWPGLGQLYLRRPVSAALFALPAVAVALLGVRELLQGPVGVALSMLDSSYALAITLALLGLGFWRIAAVVHAFAAGRSAAGRSGSSRRSFAGIVTVAVLLVGIVAMHAVPSYYAYAAYGTDVVIAEPAATVDEFEQTPDPSEAPVLTTPEPGLTFTPAADPTPSTTSGTATHPATRPPRHDLTTILLVGVDYEPGRSHSLTDTMLLVSIDRTARRVAMVSVPRDTTMFPLYWNGGTLGSTFKLNALTTAVANRWFKAPDDPMTTLKKEIGYIVGVRVDYYAQVNLPGFSRMIDAVGGVDVWNAKSFYDPSEGQRWNAGRLHLDGRLALLYVRSRKADNDYARASRQQDVLVALEKKVTTPDIIVRLPSLLSVARGTIRTDYPLDQAKGLAQFAQGLPGNAVSRCVLGPPYNYHPDSATTRGVWTSRLYMDRVANLSVSLFGSDSRYYGQQGVTPKPCGTV